jgi:ribulose-5-phosphate 4-epimerase/fuculose-1-phosphate aldolase
MSDVSHTLARLIASHHILHKYRVLNESGTISLRNPSNPVTFITSNRPPILVSSPADLTEYYINDTSVVQQIFDNPSRAPANLANTEIYIHSRIYARYPGVQSIVHSSAVDFVVYGLCDANGSMLRSVCNTAGFVNEFSPIFDPTIHRAVLPTTHPQNLMVDHPTLGDALAESMTHRASAAENGAETGRLLPEHHASFIRGNGAVLWAEGLEEVVYKAIQLRKNAEIQTAAMMQRAGSDLEITYLSNSETVDSQRAKRVLIESSWRAWAVEVSRSPIYRNELGIRI